MLLADEYKQKLEAMQKGQIVKLLNEKESNRTSIYFQPILCTTIRVLDLLYVPGHLLNVPKVHFQHSQKSERQKIMPPPPLKKKKTIAPPMKNSS